MALTTVTLPFPRIVDNGDGTVTFTMGKISWREDADLTLLNIGTVEDSVKLYSRIWCIEHRPDGYQTWADLVTDSAGLTQYLNQMAVIRVETP